VRGLSLVISGGGFAAILALWAITSWLTLRYGLTRGDREALGGLSRRLRLV